MRVVVFVLLGLNVLYLAWAGWIDTPAPAPSRPASTDPLPQLALISESVSSAATASAATTAAPPPSASLTQPVSTTPARDANRCVSIGPFNDLAQAARGAALLRERGFDPKQRAEKGEMWEGYWVSVGDLGSPADETRLMKALDRAGIRDARVMPDEPGGRRDRAPS